MKFGFDVPLRGSVARPENMTRLAVEGEALGYGYLVFADHIVFPREIKARYPYSQTGAFPNMGAGDVHEQLTTIAYLAAKTVRIRFLTSVMVVPHRPAVQTAKVISTIDVLSGGRITVGCGAGWLKEEFEAIGAPDFAARGEVTNEYLEAFRELWTKEAPHYEGRHVRFSDILFAPKPVQKPHPPLWIGGESGPALRRAARLGDGWYPIGVNPQFPLDSMPRYRAAVERLRALLGEAGRDPAAFDLAYRSTAPLDGEAKRAGDGERQLLSGPPEAVIADIEALRELGVGTITLPMGSADLGQMLGRMNWFRDEVMDKR